MCASGLQAAILLWVRGQIKKTPMMTKRSRDQFILPTTEPSADVEGVSLVVGGQMLSPKQLHGSLLLWAQHPGVD